MKNFIIPAIALNFFSSVLFLVSSSSSFSPIDHYLINCGSDYPAVIDLDHRRFTGDSSTSATPLTRRGISLTNSDLDYSNSSPLYLTARAFSSPSKYSFPIQAGGAQRFFLVRLHFFPSFNSTTSFDFSEVHFHVLANGFLLLRDFSIRDFRKDDGVVIIKEYIISVDDSDKLDLTFVPKKRTNFAFVNAIEVISAPNDLIADVAQFVSSDKIERINGLLNKGFETVYRVNVGGPKVTPFNDSLWRTWVPDGEYFEKTSEKGSLEIHFSGRILYQIGGASREVGPDNVYSSARVIKSSNNIIPKSNINWMFPVSEGYNYLVRMHFCDIASIGPNLLYFNVYVNGNLAYEDLDLSAMTNTLLASPFYADFVVEGLSSGSLNISVGPSNTSLTNAVDAILNGVEIFKISNSMGSFDGEVCAESVMKSWRRGNAGVIVPLLASVFLLLTALVVLQRRSGRDTLGWSRLPVDVSEINLKYGSQQPSSKL